MKDYEKKYKEALERAKKYKLKEDLIITQDIFPELAESEDERIRKALIHLVNSNKELSFGIDNYDGIKWSDIIAWLEKQGKHTNFRNKIQIGDKVTRNKDGVLVNLSQLNRVAKKDEKQGEQKYTDTDNKFLRMRETKPANIVEFLDRLTTVEQEFLWEHIEKVKKIDREEREQKIDDKAEPKFHKGEWITNGDYTWKIIEVKPLDYILQSQDGNIVDDTISHVDEQFHSFTIEDAKDGDVLYECNEKKPFIFKELKTKHIGDIASYCDIFNGIFNPNEDSWTTLDIVPATKEQRDTLMKAMSDAGYTFDFEKKELKKIENEIEIPFSAKDSELQEVTYYIPKGFHAEIEGNNVIIKKGEQKPAWSKEDEMIALSIEQVMNCASLLNIVPEKIDKIRTWLKSLKDRVQPQPKPKWKPSTFHLECVEDAIAMYKECGINSIGLKDILEELKKLREE